MKRAHVALVLALGASACHGHSATPSADAAPSASAGASSIPAADRDARLARLLSAEQRRAAGEISAEDLSSRDVVVRRHAARALARIADEDAAKSELRALADEDAEVVAWAAYGLGFACKGREPTTVRALVTRAASLAVEPAKSSPPSRLDPVASLADALGRCGTPEAESTLRAWLEDDERANAAALALGRMASRKKRLDDASVVALLDLASRPEKPLGSALFAFSRLSGLNEGVQNRLLEVASDVLTSAAGERRAFAVRALAAAGPKAVGPLAHVLEDTSFSVAERADAAHALGKLEAPGQAALGHALGGLEPKPTELASLSTAAWGPLISVLDVLEPPARDAKAALERLASLEPPKNDAALARRVVTLRCRAATILAGESPGFPKLASCDPDPQGTTGQLALVKVLDRGKLDGARIKRWRALTESKAPLVRQAAIALIGAHPEIPLPAPILAKALRAPDPGSVVAAAEVIADYPDRAAEKQPPRKLEHDDEAKPDKAADKQLLAPEPAVSAEKPHPAVVDALTTAFTVQRPPDAIEVWTGLMQAAAALQLLSFKPKLDAFCKSDNPTLREHAEKALRVLGEQKRVCKAAAPGKAPPELGKTVPAHAKLVFETDAGELELELDSSLAPVTVERFIELARAGFFDGIAIHRVVPGFVVQFGDPGGDGVGGAGKEPLRCETSPLPFEPLSVAVALAGRDTGSSQFFVTLGEFPHLDGDYPLIGHAKPGWDRVAQGDVIRKVRVVD